jgi:hypothetical protein
MSVIGYIVRGSCLISLIAVLAGCVIAPGPREGYYDQPHHRYYHDRAWHDCDDRRDRDDRDDRCR